MLCYQESYYTVSADPEACIGTSAACPCAFGFACVEIAACHWKCLAVEATAPPTSIQPTSSIELASSVETTLSAPTISGTPGQPSNSTPTMSVLPTASASLSPPLSQPTPTMSTHTGTATGYTGHGTSPVQSGSGAPKTITISVFPSTCPVRTRTRTVLTTDTVTSCPATCPS